LELISDYYKSDSDSDSGSDVYNSDDYSDSGTNQSSTTCNFLQFKIDFLFDFVPRLPVDELDGLALAGKGRRPYTVPKGTNPKSSYFN
jgi:hypothetical protein